MIHEADAKRDVSPENVSATADEFVMEIVEFEGAESDAEGNTVFFRSCSSCTCTC